MSIYAKTHFCMLWLQFEHDEDLIFEHTALILLMKYRIYPKYLDTSTPYHTCSEIWTRTIYYPTLCVKIAEWGANSVDPDEMPHSVASHLGLHCLLWSVCPNTYGKYGRHNIIYTIKCRLELSPELCWALIGQPRIREREHSDQAPRL